MFKSSIVSDCWQDGESVIESLDFEDNRGINFVILIALFIFWRAVAFAALKWRLEKEKKRNK